MTSVTQLKIGGAAWNRCRSSTQPGEGRGERVESGSNAPNELFSGGRCGWDEDRLCAGGCNAGACPGAYGYTGLVAGKKAAVVYTGGVYGPGAAPAFGSDYHSTFFNGWLRFIGINDITEIRFQPNILTATPDVDRALASQQARDAAKRF